MAQQATAPSIMHAPKTKITVKHIQDMKGKEPIAMFCTNEPWLIAAAETAGINIVRTYSWGENEQDRIHNCLSTIRQLRKAAPNIVMNPILQPTIVAESDEAACRWGANMMGEGADIILCLAITNKRLEAMVSNRIPVFCHVGLTPTWYTEWTGGYGRVGKTADAAMKIFKEAYEYQEAGAAMITTEMTPYQVTTEMAKRLRIPVLSIAGGAGGDGAELVVHDLLGIIPTPIPKHAKQYRQFFNDAVAGLKEYSSDIKSLAYPDKEQHSWAMDPAEYEGFLNAVEHFSKK
jgi:3-methyl-2-oxobutanoate hydroxymethyltransferase